MKKEKNITITYLFPGSFFSESSEENVRDTNIPKSIPADCFGFEFYETEYIIDESTKKKFTGERKKIGKTYLIGDLIHIDDIPEIDEFGRNCDILKANIRCNSSSKRGIKCRTGNWQLDNGEVIVLSPSEFKITEPRLYKNYAAK